MFSHGQMLAADGRCKTFDESADGYARAEGCGMRGPQTAFRRPARRRQVLALIRGTAIGPGRRQRRPHRTERARPGAGLPVRPARGRAGARGDIQYVEAHGTGTPLGDPIELGAIGNVFAASHTRERPLLVGSAKTNVGHMEPASGIVGVIKTVLQLRDRAIYPHLNLTEPVAPDPVGQLSAAGTDRRRTVGGAETRRAMVNSFGFAGTIAAVVLEEAPEPAPAPEPEVGSGGVRTVRQERRRTAQAGRAVPRLPRRSPRRRRRDPLPRRPDHPHPPAAPPRRAGDRPGRRATAPRRRGQPFAGPADSQGRVPVRRAGQRSTRAWVPPFTSGTASSGSTSTAATSCSRRCWANRCAR